MLKIFVAIVSIFCATLVVAQAPIQSTYVSEKSGNGYFAVSMAQESAQMLISSTDYPGVIRAFNDLQEDILKVTGKKTLACSR